MSIPWKWIRAFSLVSHKQRRVKALDQMNGGVARNEGSPNRLQTLFSTKINIKIITTLKEIVPVIVDVINVPAIFVAINITRRR
jgi:hypothetical protein